MSVTTNKNPKLGWAFLLTVQLAENFTQAGGGDVSVALLVVEAEGFTKLLLHRFGILLNDKLGSQLDKLVEFQASRFILIDLLDHVVQNLLVEGLSHQAEDLSHRLSGDASSLRGIEAVKRLLQNCCGEE